MKPDVKEKIVLVAQKTFQRYGFRKTTMDEIAYEARKGKSSLYYYFKSKEEVFQAVVEKEAGLLRSEINMNINKCSSAVEKLHVYINTRMEGFKNWGNFYVALKDDYLSNLDFIEKIRAKYDKNEIESITQIIHEGIENKEFKNMNAELTAKTIVIAMKGLEIPLLSADDMETNFKKEISNMLEILFHGICR
jgi:AcrR family transcriptional regulator